MPENRPMGYKKPSSRIAGAVLTATERAQKNRAAAQKTAEYQKKVSDAVKQAGNTKQESANRAKTLANTRQEYAASASNAASGARENPTPRLAEFNKQRVADKKKPYVPPKDLRVEGKKNPGMNDLDTRDRPGETTLGKQKTRGEQGASRPRRELSNTGVEVRSTKRSPNKRTGVANKVPKSGTSPKPAPAPDKNFGGKSLTKSLRPRYRPGG